MKFSRTFPFDRLWKGGNLSMWRKRVSGNLDRYVPEFDEEEHRLRLEGVGRDDLLEMLIRAYKEKLVWAKLLDEAEKKLSRIQAILNEPTAMLKAPGIPNDEDLRKMTGME